jgi:RNA polymerase sigma factor (sigma-70 family)
MEDADEFADLYRREGEAVLIFLTRRSWDGEVALELTAETFALALQSWRRLRPLTAEQRRAWLFTVAARQLSRHWRRLKLERRALRRLGVRVPAIDDEDLQLIERRAGLPLLRQRLACELERLSVDQREALTLRVIEQRSYEEIAVRLGISQQTARARVSRALRALSSSLGPCEDGLLWDGPPATQEGGS